jgi:hypothetical protein
MNECGVLNVLNNLLSTFMIEGANSNRFGFKRLRTKTHVK